MHDGINNTKHGHYLSDFISANDRQVITKLFLHNSIFFNGFKFFDTKFHTTDGAAEIIVITKHP